MNIALGNAQATQCAAVDADGNGQVAINELIAAVTSALSVCPFTGEFTGTADIGNDQIAVINLQVAPTELLLRPTRHRYVHAQRHRPARHCRAVARRPELAAQRA